MSRSKIARFHLPGLFEFYEFYKVFLPLFEEHKEYFYDFARIGSIYGAPADCLWGGGRVGFGDDEPRDVADLMKKYGISARLTFSNSLIKEEHLSDKKCNAILECFNTGKSLPERDDDIFDLSGHCSKNDISNGIIIYSDLLLDYIKGKFPGYYFVSTTTKVITDFNKLKQELERDEFSYVVPDFRLNKKFEELNNLDERSKSKVEFLCNECCDFGCMDRKECYENVSRMAIGEECSEHICKYAVGTSGYMFSKAMNNQGFIGLDDIVNTYIPMGFSEFKIEGRSLGSALLLEFILYYMVKPEYRLNVREHIYLDATLDLF